MKFTDNELRAIISRLPKYTSCQEVVTGRKKMQKELSERLTKRINRRLGDY